MRDVPSTLTELRSVLQESMTTERREHFGSVRAAWAERAENSFWDEKSHSWRLDLLARHGVLPGRQRVLDLSSGCGQFVLLALQHGYNCEGLEPSPWKGGLVNAKIDLSGYPSDWKTRFHQGIGEALPFEDSVFDYITSFQTLEHVQDPSKVIAEMVRVTRVGGAIHIMCPDYRSTFEAHYQLPWLPLFPRVLARSYLRFLGRPVKGLETIQYVTKPRILAWIRKIEVGKKFLVTDEDRVSFENGMRRHGWPLLPGAYCLWRAWPAIRYLGRREFGVSLLIRILQK